MAAIFRLEQHPKSVKKHCVFDRFHAKVVVLLEASSNFKVWLADEISSRAFFVKDVRSGMQAKMRWRVFAFGGVSQNVEKPCVFC